MRKYKRSIARHAMKVAGVERMNKPPIKSGGRKSFFAINWEEYLEKYLTYMSKRKTGRRRQRLFQR